MRLVLLLLFLLFFAPLLLHAQDYNYTHYTTREGLPSETVYTISQDRAGFLWFAGETGLSRFDGRRFKNYSVADGLPSNEVFGFYEDDYGRLWIKSFSNKICFYKDGRIHNQQNDTLLSRISFTGELDEILGSTEKQVILFDKSGQVIVLDSNNKISRYQQPGFRLDYKHMRDNRWIRNAVLQLPPAMEQGLLQYLQPGESFRIYKTRDYAFLPLPRPVARGDIAVWDHQKGTFRDIINFFPCYSEGDLVAGFRRNGGACLYNLQYRQTTGVFLPEYIINDVYKDRENNLWFSTKEHGVFKLSNARPVTYKIPNHKVSSVRFIYGADNGIFLGTHNDGIWKISSITQDMATKVTRTKLPMQQGLHWLQQYPNLFINYTGADFLNLENWHMNVKSIYTFDDSLLVATSGGAATGSIKSFSRNAFRVIFKDRTTCAIKHQGFYYIGTLYGLFVLDAGYHIIAQPLNCRISHFAAGADGSLWIAAYDRGIFRLKHNQLTDSINEGNSVISSNTCRRILLTGNELWAGTDKGLNRIRITDSGCTVTAVYTAPGWLNSNTINAILVTDSTVYAGTSEGLCAFNRYPDTGNPLFNLALTDMSVSGRDMAWQEEPVLNHGNNDIKFGFSAISFSLQHISYRYYLAGLTTHWEETTEPVLNFFALPSGNYELQVQAIDQMGNRSPVMRKKFRVKMALYEHWWFRAGVLLVVAGGILFLLQLRIKKIKKTEAEKTAVGKRIAALEQMALRAQMNPHFIFNCLNSIQGYILKSDVAGANFYLSEFGNLVRQTLENAPKLYIPLREEITYLRHYIELERLQINQAFDYDIRVDARLLDLPFPNMILQPYVENAIKHGLNKNEAKGRLSIAFDRPDMYTLTCIIEDDGPGIESVSAGHNKAHNSKGMLLTQQRIATLNQLGNEVKDIVATVTDLRHTGKKGTRVKISLQIVTPYKK